MANPLAPFDDDEELDPIAPPDAGDALDAISITPRRKIDASRGNPLEYSPGLKAVFADEVKAAETVRGQQDVLDRMAVRSHAVQKQRQQVAADRAAKAAATQSKKDLSAAKEADFRTRGVRHFVDANGEIQPEKDETGATRFVPKTGEVQFDPKTGEAFRLNRTEKGTEERDDLDKNAPLGAHQTDLANVYKHNSHSPWRAIASIEEGLQSPDPKVREAAAKARANRDSVLKKAATSGFDALRGQISTQEVEERRKYQGVMQQRAAIEQEIEQIKTKPEYNQTDAGAIFGFGKQPTATAQSLKNREQELTAQLATLEIADPDDKENRNRFKILHDQVADEAAAFEALIAKHGGIDPALNEFIGTLEASGKNPEENPVVKSIAEAREKGGLPRLPERKKNDPDAALRSHPLFSEVLTERDALQTEVQERGTKINAEAQAAFAAMEPMRAQINDQAAQHEELRKQAEVITQQLEAAVPGQGALQDRLGKLSPEQFAKVQPLLQSLAPISGEMSRIGAQLQPLLQQHQDASLEHARMYGDDTDPGELRRTAEQEIGQKFEAWKGKADRANELAKLANEDEAKKQRAKSEKFSESLPELQAARKQQRAKPPKLDATDIATSIVSPFGGVKKAAQLGASIGKTGGEEKEKAIREKLKADGLTDQEIDRGIEFSEALDFEEHGKPAVKLPDGRVAVNPEFAFDEKKWNEAAEASGGTPEEIAAVKAKRQEMRDALGEARYDRMLESDVFKRWAASSDENTPAGEVIEKFFAAHASSSANYLRDDAIVQAFKQQGASIANQFYGAGAFLTGNDKLTSMMQQTGQAADRAGAARKELGGAGIAGDIIDIAGSALPSLAISPFARGAGALAKIAMAGKGAATATKVGQQVALGTMAAGAGMQSAGGMYSQAHAAFMKEGLSPKDARQKAMWPTVVSALKTAALARVFTGGVERSANTLRATSGTFIGTMRDYLGRGAKDFADEWFEEFADSIGDSVIEMMSFNPKLTAEEAFDRAIEAGNMGGVAGSAVGAAGRHGERQEAFKGDIAHYGDFTAKSQQMRELLSPEVLEKMGAFKDPSAGAEGFGAKKGAEIRASLDESDAKITAAEIALQGATSLKARATASKALAEAHDARNEVVRGAQENAQLEEASKEIDALNYPNESPEVNAASKDVARAIVKLARGVEMDALTAAERTALEAPSKDGVPRFEELKGQVVISQGSIDRLKAVAPAAASLIGKSEQERRAEILAKKSTPKPAAPKAPAPAVAQASPSQTSPNASPSPTAAPASAPAGDFSVRPLEGREAGVRNAIAGKLRKEGVPADLADKFAAAHVSKNGADGMTGEHIKAAKAAFVAAGGATTESTPDEAARNTANASLAKRVDAGRKAQIDEAFKATYGRFAKAAVETLEKKTGKPLTKQQLVTVSDAVKLFAEPLARWEKAFDTIGWQVNGLGSAGVGSLEAGNATFSIEDIFGRNPDGSIDDLQGFLNNPARVDKVLREEAIHAWAQKHIAKDRAAELWGKISEQARIMTRELYTHGWRMAEGGQVQVNIGGQWVGENPHAMFHEFFRYVVEGKIDQDDIAGPERASKSILAQIKAILKQALAFFTNWADRMKADGVETAIIAEIDKTATLIAEAMLKISADAAKNDPLLQSYVAQSQHSGNRSGNGRVDSGRGPAAGGTGGTGKAVPNPGASGAGKASNPNPGNVAASPADSDATKAELERLRGEAETRKAKDEQARERRNLGVAAIAGRLAEHEEVLKQVPADARAAAEELLNRAVPGAATYVLGTNLIRLPAAYIAFPPDLVQTSHLPKDGFRMNPNYIGKNTRDYANDPTEQNKVRAGAVPGALLQDAFVTDVKSAAEGPPQVVLAIDNGPDGKPRVVVQTAGGNGRKMMADLAPVEDQQRLSDTWQERAGNYGFTNLPDTFDGYRFLGVYDLRTPAGRASYQSLVDKLNPSSGVVQDAGARAQIDAESKVPVERFAKLPLSLSADQAQDAVRGLLRDADTLGLDRNMMNSIEKDAPSAQSYMQQLILHGAFRSPAVTKFYFGRNSRESATTKGLIEASARAALALRDKGFNDVADALGRTLANVADYASKGDRIDRAIAKAAEQLEMGPGAEIINRIAKALAAKIEYHPQNKRGIVNVDAESTMDGFSELMDDLARGVAQFDPTPDLLGEAETIAQTIERGIAANVRRNQEYQTPAVNSRGVPSGIKRMRELSRKSREEGLTRAEAIELENLERQAGQVFLSFFEGNQPKFSETGPTTGKQLPLLSRSAHPADKPGTSEKAVKAALTAAVIKRQEVFEKLKPDYDAKLTAVAAALPDATPLLVKLKGMERAIEKLMVKREKFEKQAAVAITEEDKANLLEKASIQRLSESLGDILRASIVVDTIDQRVAALRGLVDAFGEENVVVEDDRFVNPTPAGYSDIQIAVTVAPGYVAELQIHVPEMLAAKEGNIVKVMKGMPARYFPEALAIEGLNPEFPGHKYFELIRNPETPADVRADAEEKSRKLYQAAKDAYERRTGGALPSAARNAASSTSLAPGTSAEGFSRSAPAALPPGPQTNAAPFSTTTGTSSSSMKNRAPGANSSGETSITTKTIRDYPGPVSVNPRALPEEGMWRVFDRAAFEQDPSAQVVPLDKLISRKDERQDKRFMAGEKPFPIATAYRFMIMANRGTEGAKARKPLDVTENEDGTFEINDGNATAQVLMLAGWTSVPVSVKRKPLPSRAIPTPETRTLTAKNAEVIGPATILLSRSAHHATPHKVDKFRLDKMGTGEGSQVYGWGLYFAESELVSGIGGEYWNRFLKETGKANSYAVDIDAEPDDLLDWDKPLSEQSEKVKAAIARIPKERTIHEASGIETGERTYARLLGSPSQKSKTLAALGIPGIQYLDAGSRFDDSEKQYPIVKRWAADYRSSDWEVQDAGTLTTISKHGTQAEAKAAQAALVAEAKKKPRTHNYVIFDESKIKITHENGRPVTMAEAAPLLSRRVKNDPNQLDIFGGGNTLTADAPAGNVTQSQNDTGSSTAMAGGRAANPNQTSQPGLPGATAAAGGRPGLGNGSAQPGARGAGGGLAATAPAGNAPDAEGDLFSGQWGTGGGVRSPGSGADATGSGGVATSPGSGAGTNGNANLGGTKKGEGSTAPSVGDVVRVEPAEPADRNFRIAADAVLAPRGDVTRVRANIDAIRLVRQLEDEDRNATPAEKETLARFVGWGGLPQVFDKGRAEKLDRIQSMKDELRDNQEKLDRKRQGSSYYYQRDHMPAEYYEGKVKQLTAQIDRIENWQKKWGKAYAELKELLSEAEWDSAMRSTLNAHYTTARIIHTMWKMAERIGFKGGNVLEPAGGIGHYFGVMPENLLNRAHLFGIELDSLSGRIMRKLYPEANIQVTGFETARIPDNSIDVAISNVPFGDYSLYDAQMEALGAPKLSIHNYFFAKALQKVKPGGLVAFITSSHTMDSTPAARAFLAQHGELVGAFRLPNSAFRENAKTDVVTDIIFIRKNSDAPYKGENWMGVGEVTSTKGDKIRVNEYFAKHPEHILGRIDNDGSMFAGVPSAKLAQVWEMAQRNWTLRQHVEEEFPAGLSDADYGRMIMQMHKDGTLQPFMTGWTGKSKDEAQKVIALASVREEMTVHQAEGVTLPEQLQSAIALLPENVLDQTTKTAGIDRETLTAGKVGSIVKKADGTFAVSGFSGEHEISAPKYRPLLTKFTAVRDALNLMFKLELTPEVTDAELDEQRENLNFAYDRWKADFGPIHAHGSLLGVDPDFYRLLGAEEEVKATKTADLSAALKRKKEYRKGDVFTKRVLTPRTEPTSAPDVASAMGMSLGWRGKLDTSYIASLTGKTAEEVEKEIIAGGMGFRNPASGLVETREQYLSGNVRTKLKTATTAQETGGDYQGNVDALRAVIPPDIEIADIPIRLHSQWVPNEIIAQFARDIFAERNIQVKAISTLSANGERNEVREFRWNDYTTAVRSGIPESARTRWGSPGMNGFRIFEHVMNMSEPVVTDDDGKYDRDRTAEAKAQANAIKDAFQEWLVNHAETHEALAKTYNEEKNGTVLEKHDGQFLQFPWLANGFDLYPDKKNVVWRGIQDGRALIAHGVGGGKTVIGTALAMEMRRLGLARKPMIVVHNATLTGFAEEIQRMAPTARVLVGRKDDLKGPKRKEFMARVAAGDWDAVIVAQSSFDMIPDDPEFESSVLRGLEEEIREAIREAGENPDNVTALADERDTDPTVKALAKQLIKLREKIRGLLDRAKDDVLNFSELGVDALIVDEAHLYKKMPFVTQQDRVAGIDNGSSKRGTGLLMKARFVQSKNKGKNVFTMTGTPVTNTLGESWNMVRLIAPDHAKTWGVERFDQFVSTFAEITVGGELRANGQYKQVSRLANIVGLPEWNQFFRAVSDVRMGEDMVVKDRPGIKGGKPELVALERTPQVTKAMEYIKGVIEWYDNLDGKEKKENSHVPLLTYAAAKMAAIDIRLFDPSATAEKGSKVEKMVDKAFELYNRSAAYKGTQVIFSDVFRPLRTNNLQLDSAELDRSKDEDDEDDDLKAAADPDGFNLYREVKRQLIARGVPESEIGIITDYKTEDRRQKLFDDVNDGKVRFVIGSTKRLGTGVNMQRRMLAAHHLDVPWTPADLEQRDGRVYRQKNIHGEMGVDVELYRYGMKDTLDAALWQKLETKERFIKQALSGNIDERSIEDDSGLMSLSEQKAVLTGPLGLRKFNAEQALKELEGEQRAFRRRLSQATFAISRLRSEKEEGQRRLDFLSKMADRVSGISDKRNEAMEVTFAGKTIRGEEEAAKAIDKEIAARKKLANEVANPETAPSVVKPFPKLTINGVEVDIGTPRVDESMADGAKNRWRVSIWASVGGLLTKHFANGGSVISSLMEQAQEAPGKLRAAKNHGPKIDAEITELEKVLAKPFTKEAQLAAARAELATAERLFNSGGVDEAETARLAAENQVAAMENEGGIPLLSKSARVDSFEEGATPAERVTKNIRRAEMIADAWDNIPGSEQDERRAIARQALVKAARAFDGDTGFGGYAATSIRNALRDHYEKQSNYTRRNSLTLDAPLSEGEETTGKDMIPGGDNVQESAASNDATALLNQLIDELPAHLRDVVLGLRDGKTLEAIGADLGGITKQGTSRRAQVGLERLRQKLGERGITSSALLSRSASSAPMGDDAIYAEMRSLQRLAGAETSGQRTVGRPDLALGTLDPLVMAVDEWRKTYLKPETHAQWQTTADKMLADDYEGTKRTILNMSASGTILRAEEVKAAMQIVAKEVQRAGEDPNNEDLQRDVQMLVNSYREARAEQARGLASGRDPFKTPAERYREFLAKVIFQAPPEVQKKLDEAKGDPEATKKILSEDAKRIARIKAALDKLGVTFEDLFSGEVELRLKAKKIAENELSAAKGKDSDILKAFTEKRNFAVVSAELKVTEAEVRRVVKEAAERVKKRHYDKFAKGATAANVDAIKSKTAAPAADAEFAKFLDMLGLTEETPAQQKKRAASTKKPKGKPFDITDPVSVVRIARTIESLNSGMLSMAMEYWMNNILSGWQTHVVNVSGNALNAAWDMTVQRGTEALLNAAIGNDKAAQIGEAKYLLRGISGGIQRARQLAEMAWTAEYDFTEHLLLGKPIDLQDVGGKVAARGAIPGVTGRVVRMPGRALMYADSFFKGLIATMEVGAQAFRVAKAEGLTGDALEKRIKEQVDTPGSPAWVAAVEKAKELTFQQELRSWADTAGEFPLARVAEALGNALQRASIAVPPLRFIVPFVRTPYNILRTGLRKTPLGSLALGWDVLSYAMGSGKNWMARIRGNTVEANPKMPATFTRDFAEQAIAWATAAFIWGAIEGDDDDDKKKILITGSSSKATKDSWGLSELQKRTRGGDYILRVGDSTFAFGRYEPFATVLGTLADTVKVLKSKRADKADALVGYALAQAENKTFLRGIGEMLATVRETKGVGGKAANFFASALVPNIIRQPLRNIDEYARDTKGGGMAYAAFPMASNAPIKRDAYGEPVEKEGNAALRTIIPVPLKTPAQARPADRLLQNWNRNNPSDRWAPQPPERTYRDAKTKADVQMTPEQYEQHAALAGKIVTRKLAGKITERMIANPTEKDLDMVRDAFRDARREARDQQFNKKARLDLPSLMW